jgi:hypothetical protein
MRTYGRTRDVLTGKKTWWQVTTDVNGFNDGVYLTTLAQVCKLNLGESPFFANYGIPAHPSVVMQIYPDYYMARTQQQFAGYFASLILMPAPIAQGAANSDDGRPVPGYNIQVLTNYGSQIGVTTAPGYPQQQPI